MSELWIGTSGYQYDHWKGCFYPEDLPKKRWFDFYSEQFDTVEINNSFYRLPGKNTFSDWASRAPEGFLYVFKYSRFGTHMKHLKDPEDHLEKFLDASEPCHDEMGPVLVQLPPRWKVDLSRLSEFLEAAPEDVRWAIELRDSTWLCDSVFELLAKHRAALVVHDMLEDHPREATTDFMYFRFHGKRYTGSYSPQYLSARAEEFRGHLDAGRDVYAYFNNDDKGYAVDNALTLKRFMAA